MNSWFTVMNLKCTSVFPSDCGVKLPKGWFPFPRLHDGRVVHAAGVFQNFGDVVSCWAPISVASPELVSVFQMSLYLGHHGRYLLWIDEGSIGCLSLVCFSMGPWRRVRLVPWWPGWGLRTLCQCPGSWGCKGGMWCWAGVKLGHGNPWHPFFLWRG